VPLKGFVSWNLWQLQGLDLNFSFAFSFLYVMRQQCCREYWSTLRKTECFNCWGSHWKVSFALWVAIKSKWSIKNYLNSILMIFFPLLHRLVHVSVGTEWIFCITYIIISSFHSYSSVSFSQTNPIILILYFRIYFYFNRKEIVKIEN